MSSLVFDQTSPTHQSAKSANATTKRPVMDCGHPFQHATLYDWQYELDQCPHTCGCLDAEGVFGVFRFVRSYDISKNPSAEDCQRHLVDKNAHPRCDETCDVRKCLVEYEYDRLAGEAETGEAERSVDLSKTRE
jgi:hypothetical protein